MSEETKKIEKTKTETEPEVKPAELSEQDLDKIAGGGTLTTSKSGIKTVAR